MTVWFVTGASRGLGAAIVEQALLRGDSVVAAARRPDTISVRETGDRVLAVALDVTDEQSAQRAVAAAVDRFGRLDVVVNNAGISLVGAVEEASASEVEAVFATNLFGTLNVVRAVLPVMRAQLSGSVVNIGSMGGFAQSPGWGIYGATKFALEGISEAMAAELAPLGIRVMIVEPGSFRTDFLDAGSLQSTRTRIDDYAATVGVVRAATSARNGSQINDPVKGAAAIVRAVTAENPPTRLQIGPRRGRGRGAQACPRSPRDRGVASGQRVNPALTRKSSWTRRAVAPSVAKRRGIGVDPGGSYAARSKATW